MAYRGLDLTGKTAVVVGGTSGIGRAIALGLAHAGADVINWSPA
jgi:NAD(P)-dependent dehydrogenase (short-subunit alcohol dehydrogenase family)